MVLLIIGYAPCINHGLKGGMQNSQNEIKKAVKAGYWHLYRYNRISRKKAKIHLSSFQRARFHLQRLPDGRSSLRFTGTIVPAEASELFAKTEQDARERYEFYGPGRKA